MTGTVSEWEEWAGIALPSSGDYVIPRGLSVLHIDREADLGLRRTECLDASPLIA